MQKTLLTNAPSIEERAKKAKTGRRGQGASGRLHRTEAGDWVWSSDEDEEKEKETANNGSENHASNENHAQHNNKNANATTTDNQKQVETNSVAKGDANSVAEPINLVLRIRNAKKELNDIRFEFTVNKGLSYK